MGIFFSRDKDETDDDHVCESGADRYESTGDPRYEQLVRYCVKCGALTMSQIVKAR